MIKIEGLKLCDKTNTSNSKEWFLSVSHQVDSEDGLELFLALFVQSINEHFETSLKVYSKETDVFKEYPFGKNCVLTFFYKDFSLCLSIPELVENNKSNFNYN